MDKSPLMQIWPLFQIEALRLLKMNTFSKIEIFSDENLLDRMRTKETIDLSLGILMEQWMHLIELI